MNRKESKRCLRRFSRGNFLKKRKLMSSMALLQNTLLSLSGLTGQSRTIDSIGFLDSHSTRMKFLAYFATAPVSKFFWIYNMTCKDRWFVLKYIPSFHVET